MLEPKDRKHRKVHRNQGLKRNKYAVNGTRLSFGDYGLKALEEGEITSRQLEAARVAINRYLKRDGKVWIRVFPDKTKTKTPAETRMGKGKGEPHHFVAPVQPGNVVFEVGGGAGEEEAREALRLGKHKLPIKTKFVVRPGSRADQQQE